MTHANPPQFPSALAPVSRSRRQHLKALALLPLAGTGLFAGSRQALAASASCILAPQMTEGPYWVDEKLDRSDITTGTTRSSVLNGVPMSLDILVYDNNGQVCGSNSASSVQIDIWHCDAAGEYSDANGQGQGSTIGQTFLRGYQVTNNDGKVSFTTIYPGWYRGRATHIHLRARVYDASGNRTYNFTSQIFFDDSFTDTIYQKALYASRGTRDTRNSNDSIYRGASQAVEALLSTRSDGSVQAEVVIGLSGLPASTTYRQFAATGRNEGSAQMPTVVCDLTAATADVGRTVDIYVAAEAEGGALYFNNGSTWVAQTNRVSSGFPAFSRGVLAATQSLTILQGMDTSALGRINLYIGYGTDNADLIQNQRFALVSVLNG